MPEFKKREEQEGEPELAKKPMTVIAWTKSPLGAILRLDPDTPEAMAKLKAKTQLKTFLANESGGIKDENIVYEILEPGDNSDFDKNLPPRLVSAIDFQGQIIELNKDKAYIVAVNSEDVAPEQAYYIMEQLSEAGIKTGVLLASRSDQPVMYIDEHPLELGDGDRQSKRINARTALAEAQNKLQTAAREFICTHAEVMEQLDLHKPTKRFEELSDLFVAIERAYSMAEAQLDEDQMEQQKSLEADADKAAQ